MKTITLEPGQPKQLRENLRLMLTFIDANLSEQAKAHPGAGLKRARKALRLKLDNSDDLTEIGFGLLFAVDFAMQRYQGPCNVIADAFVVLGEIGLMERHREEITPGHPLHGALVSRA